MTSHRRFRFEFIRQALLIHASAIRSRRSSIRERTSAPAIVWVFASLSKMHGANEKFDQTTDLALIVTMVLVKINLIASHALMNMDSADTD